jgi:hypothetical protein
MAWGGLLEESGETLLVNDETQLGDTEIDLFPAQTALVGEWRSNDHEKDIGECLLAGE